MKCVCDHPPWRHGLVTYPRYRRPCTVCVGCGGNSVSCCREPKKCSCKDFRRTAEVVPVDESRWAEQIRSGAIGDHREL